MSHKRMLCAVFMLFALFATAPIRAGNQDNETITGTVEQIAPDGTHIVVSGQKILTSPGFLEDSMIEPGDQVLIKCITTDEGLRAIDYQYISEDVPLDTDAM